MTGAAPQRSYEGTAYSSDYTMASQGQFTEQSSGSAQQQYYGNQGYQYMDEDRSVQQPMQTTGYQGYRDDSPSTQYSASGADSSMARYQDSNVSGYGDNYPQDSYSDNNQSAQETGSGSVSSNSMFFWY